MHSSGLWRQRAAIAALLEMEPVRLLPWRSSFDAVVGWGFKPSSRKAILAAERLGRPYIAIEDGFYRSIRPGGMSRYAWIVDRTGIYYDAARPSDLEGCISSRIAAGLNGLDRIRGLKTSIVRNKLTKYNDARLIPLAQLGVSAGHDVVLVVDQTVRDASVSGSGADEATFMHMLEAAIAENPGRRVVIKQHPETVSRQKSGYLARLERDARVVMIGEAVNPWSFLDGATRVYVVSSQLGFDALLAGLPVTCFGAPFYAGWGLTDDRAPVPASRRGKASIDQLAAAALLDYNVYLDPQTFAPLEIETVLERLVIERARLLGEAGTNSGRGGQAAPKAPAMTAGC